MNTKTKQKNTSSAGDAVVQIASLLIGKPYQRNTLDGSAREKLMVNVLAFDCTTFIETVLAMTRCALLGKLTPAEFKKHLKFIRYRGGKIQGYASRLHYFTDWLRDNGKKGVLIDITGRLGGKPRRKKIDFMTAHPALYPQLKNPSQFSKMKAVEKLLSRRTFRVLDGERLTAQACNIRNGDIIAFMSGQEGLDVAHVGLALWQKKNLHLLHASQKEGKVIVSKKTLLRYLKSHKKFIGVMVARPR